MQDLQIKSCYVRWWPVARAWRAAVWICRDKRTSCSLRAPCCALVQRAPLRLFSCGQHMGCTRRCCMPVLLCPCRPHDDRQCWHAGATGQEHPAQGKAGGAEEHSVPASLAAALHNEAGGDIALFPGVLHLQSTAVRRLRLAHATFHSGGCYRSEGTSQHLLLKSCHASSPHPILKMH